MVIERVVRQIRAKGDVWFAPPLEVANFWKSRTGS
jgi:hypothetical protein